MEQKAKAQVLKGFYSCIKLVLLMDKIYGRNRLEETIENANSEVFPEAIRVYKAVNEYIKYGTLSHSATSIADVKIKEAADKAKIEARKNSRVEEYMEKRKHSKGESDLEYYTGILGAAYGNVIVSYNLRHDEILDRMYDKFIRLMNVLDWKDITSDDLDTILKQSANAYKTASNTVLNLNRDIRAILTEQNFMCNYAGMNTFTDILIVCEMVKEVAKFNFKPDRIGVEQGMDYIYVMERLADHSVIITNEVMKYYNTNRLYETGELDIAKMTLDDALSLSYRNTVMASFAIKHSEGVDSDTVAEYNNYFDEYLIDEWEKSLKDKKYKPNYGAIVLELIYNEKSLIEDRLGDKLDIQKTDAPNLRVIGRDGKINGLKNATKNYLKITRAVSRWVVEQFGLDWDAGIYDDKRNGILLTIIDKAKANRVFNLERPRINI